MYSFEKPLNVRTIINIRGLNIRGYHSKEEQTGQHRGDWVCVNVENMTYERALEVCKHEVGHEIFAEECEKDIDICFNIMEKLK